MLLCFISTSRLQKRPFSSGTSEFLWCTSMPPLHCLWWWGHQFSWEASWFPSASESADKNLLVYMINDRHSTCCIVCFHCCCGQFLVRNEGLCMGCKFIQGLSIDSEPAPAAHFYLFFQSFAAINRNNYTGSSAGQIFWTFSVFPGTGFSTLHNPDSEWEAGNIRWVKVLSGRWAWGDQMIAPGADVSIAPERNVLASSISVHGVSFRECRSRSITA